MASKHDAGLLRAEQVSERIQLGPRWIQKAVKRGEFPAPIRLSRRCTRWDARAVEQWLQKLTDGEGQS